MKKKILIIIVGIILFLFILIGCLYIFKNDDKKTLDKDFKSNIPNIILEEESGTPIFVDGNEIGIGVANVDDAYKALNQLKDLYGFLDASTEFKLISTENSMGFTYYKFNQKIDDILIYGKQLVIAVDKDNKVTSITGRYEKNIKPVNNKTLSVSEAEEKLKSSLTGRDIVIKDKKEYIYILDDKETYYTYFFSVLNENEYVDYILNAENANIIKKIDLVDNLSENVNIPDLKGVKRTLSLQVDEKYDNKYYFIDEHRNIVIADAYGIPAANGPIDTIVHKIYAGVKTNPFTVYKDQKGDYDYSLVYNTSEDKDKVGNAVSAMSNFYEIYDYYKRVLERNSYDNAGAQIIVNVGLQNDFIPLSLNNEYENAYWVSGEKEFYFGSHDGKSFAIALDVAGHEFTHGVTSAIGVLKEDGETGALNEAYSDILGSLIENKNFTIGEKLFTIRDMTNPTAFEMPFEKNGKFYYPSDEIYYDKQFFKDNNIGDVDDYDDGGVHINCGVPDYAAYLMYKNNGFDNKEQMAKVWYNSLYLLTNTSNFEDAAIAVIQSAKMLGLKEDKVKIIENAFEETKMLERVYTSISGKVTDSETKSGLESMVTLISKKNIYINYTIETDKKGNYKFDKIPAGDYTLVVEKAKYKTFEKDITIKPNNKDVFDATLKKLNEADIVESDIVFVMDISYSMFENDPSDIRKQMIVNIISSLDDNAQVALITFAKKAKVINSGLSNRKVDKAMLMTDVFNIVTDNGSTSNSGTNGRAGLDEAVLLLNENNRNSRKYIVFFTDGEDTFDSGVPYEDIVVEANKVNARILTVGLNSANSDILKMLAEKTNGKYYYAKDSGDLYGFDSRIFEELE